MSSRRYFLLTLDSVLKQFLGSKDMFIFFHHSSCIVSTLINVVVGKHLVSSSSPLLDGSETD